MANFVTINCCPVEDVFAPYLLIIQTKTGCTYASVYRGSDPGAAKYLTGGAPCYKHNQAWIYANYPPGVANPPGRSTHEKYSDGVAYLGPIGRPLLWWQCGIDVDDAHVQAFIAAAREEGWTVTITYPGSAVEYHHVNFRLAPGPIKKSIPVLKEGSKGPRVKRLTKHLHFIHSPHHGDPYLDHTPSTFNSNVVAAVKKFQADHHLTADGVVGHHTAVQIKVSVRNEARKRKVRELKTNRKDQLKKLDEAEKKVHEATKDVKKASQENDRKKLRHARYVLKRQTKKVDFLSKRVHKLHEKIVKLDHQPHKKG
jgi:hypothetical protein